MADHPLLVGVGSPGFALDRPGIDRPTPPLVYLVAPTLPVSSSALDRLETWRGPHAQGSTAPPRVAVESGPTGCCRRSTEAGAPTLNGRWARCTVSTMWASTCMLQSTGPRSRSGSGVCSAGRRGTAAARRWRSVFWPAATPRRRSGVGDAEGNGTSGARGASPVDQADRAPHALLDPEVHPPPFITRCRHGPRHPDRPRLPRISRRRQSYRISTGSSARTAPSRRSSSPSTFAGRGTTSTHWARRGSASRRSSTRRSRRGHGGRRSRQTGVTSTVSPIRLDRTRSGCRPAEAPSSGPGWSISWWS